MAFIDMQRELLGDIPGMNLPYARTLIKKALQYVCDTQRWSFQVSELGWLTPGLMGGPNQRNVSTGTISVAPYDTTIVGDAAATALWASQVGRPFITEQQIRVPYYSLYNIIGYLAGSDPTNPNAPFATLTIDRPWMEPKQTNGTYMIYQAYFPTGVQGFKRFGQIKDTTNDGYIDFQLLDQAALVRRDSQRICFDIPTFAVPYKVDARTNSATKGQMMYELYPHPLSILPYSYTVLSQGATLTLPSDTLPYPLSEELIMWRAKETGYLWKESQLGEDLQRGSGADWRFLSQAANAEYQKSLKLAKLLDVGLGDLYWSKFERRPRQQNGYETILGTLNVGTF